VRTDRSVILGQFHHDDGSPDGHSTQTASKALGEKYGFAKRSKLVIFELADYEVIDTTVIFGAGTYV
jgi:hypothetical protein